MNKPGLFTGRAHPLHALRKCRFFRALSRTVDPMIARQLPLLAQPIYLRLLSHASLIFDGSIREASIHETFAAILRGLPRDQPAAFWDLGANIGWFSWQCATLRPDFEIVSFEPDAKNLQCLRRTSRRWRLPLQTIVPCAVAERTGRAPFFVDDIAGATGSLEESQSFNLFHYQHRARPIEVETLSLDDFLATCGSPPSVVKIDVEGAELRVLQGASKLLSEHRPILFFESFSHRDEILPLLQTYGYLIYDSDRHQGADHETTNFIAVVPTHCPSVTPALAALGYPVDSHHG